MNSSRSFAVSLVLLGLGSICSAIRCPSPDWINRKGTDKCYYIHKIGENNALGPASEKGTWKEAQSECMVRGGKLIILNDSNEFEWLKAKLDDNQWYWLGLTYENSRWEWYDGEKFLPYSPIPNLNVINPTLDEAMASQQRGALRYNSTINQFEFRYNTAYNDHGYICRGDFSSKAWCKVEDGWTYRNGNCYRYNPVFSTFAKAEATCLKDGGFISVPSSKEEDTQMKKWLRDTMDAQHAWIGISIKNKNSNTTYDTVKWADGTAIGDLQINNWDKNDMREYINGLANGLNYCGVLFTLESEEEGWGQSEDYAHDWSLRNDCDSPKPFICEAPLNKCPYGWRELDDHCYRFHSGEDNLRSWQDSRAQCKKQGSDLVVIRDGRMQEFLEDLLDDLYFWINRNYYWIGIEGSSNLQWINGSSLDYTNWSGSEGTAPKFGPDECVYMDGNRIFDKPSYKINGQWNATLCSEKFNFVCQAHYTANIITDAVIHPPLTCSPPFVLYHDGCYLVVSEKMNRDNAQLHCQNEQKSVLAIIRSFGENIWLQDQMTSDSWIGLKIIDVSSDGEKYIYEYSDRTRAGERAFMNFYDKADPTDSHTREKYCVAFASINSQYNTTASGGRAPQGKWYHVPCTETRAFVCYHDGNPRPTGPVHENHFDARCGAGWFRNGDNCYRVHTNYAPWRLAKQTCQNADITGDLLWMSTKEEEAFIKNFIQRNQSSNPMFEEWEDEDPEDYEDNYWIDFYADTSSSNWYWPYRKYPNKWHIPVAVTNWAKGQPQIPTGAGSSLQTPRCAYIDTDWTSSQWRSTNCDDSHAFICKKTLPPVVPPTIKPKPTVLPGQILGCRAGWIIIDDRCVQFNIATLTWHAARSFCRSLGGDLLTVRSDTDWNNIKHFASGSWIGLNAVANDDNPRIFEWSDDADMLYTPWDIESSHGKSPNGMIHDVNCGAFTPKGFVMYSCDEKRPSICGASLSPINGSTPTAISIPHDKGCEIWGLGFHDRCYYFGEDPASQVGARPVHNFDAARDFCRNRFNNADLVIINDKEEQAFINAYTARFASEFWIGLRQSLDQGVSFNKWIDNTVLTTANWAFSEPTAVADGPRRCVALHGVPSETVLPGDWYTDSCEERKFALCEGGRSWHPPHATTPKPSITEKPVSCPAGWKSDGYPSCYKAYFGQAEGEIKKVTWQQAEDFCRRFPGGHLATVNSYSEQYFLTFTLLRSMDRTMQTWLGLYQDPEAQNKWLWVDGKALTYTNWENTGQNHETHEPDCVGMEVFSGTWIAQSCQQTWGWICEMPKGIFTEGQLIENFPEAIETNRTCGSNTPEGEWFYSSATEECLYFSRKSETWNNAQATCRALGSNLVTVSNKSHDFITLKSNQFAMAPNRFWIGLYQVDSVTLEHAWIDGHISYFRAWENGEPNPSGHEQCVAHNSWSGKWKDLNCARTLPFICHKSDRVPISVPTQDPLNGACLADWVEFRGACYYFSGPANKTFGGASTECRTANSQASLVSIHSSLENDFILSQVRRAHYKHQGRIGKEGSDRPSVKPTGGRLGEVFDFWIGLHDNGGDDVLGWTDQSLFDYTNWHPKEPTTYPKDACITFRTNFARAGLWSNTGCLNSERHGYICKALKIPDAQPILPLSTQCPTGYTLYGENCFSIEKLDNGEATWSSAQVKCQSIGDKHGSIATVVDIYENAEIRVLFNEALRSDSNGNATAWIGMQEHMGSYTWHNTCPVTYSNFQNLFAKPEEALSCVRMTMDGKWEAASCNTNANYVVCERRTVPCPAVHNITDDTLFCPIDFPQECNRSCYRVVVRTNHHNNTEQHSIDTARGNCTKLGGHLASVRTEEDQTCLLKYIEYATQPMWIGLNGFENPVGPDTEHYNWQWETPDKGLHFPSTFVNWEKDYPKPVPMFSSYTCVEMKPNGKWENRHCATWETDAGYICENRKERRDVTRRTTQAPLPPLTRPSLDTNTTTLPSTRFNLDTNTTMLSSSLSPVSGKGDIRPNMSGGSVAGIVIGVLLALGILGTVAFIIVTGRTRIVVTRVQSMTTTVRNNSARFLPRRFRRNAEDRELTIPYKKTMDSTYDESRFNEGGSSYT